MLSGCFGEFAEIEVEACCQAGGHRLEACCQIRLEACCQAVLFEFCQVSTVGPRCLDLSRLPEPRFLESHFVSSFSVEFLQKPDNMVKTRSGRTMLSGFKCEGMSSSG